MYKNKTRYYFTDQWKRPSFVISSPVEGAGRLLDSYFNKGCDNIHKHKKKNRHWWEAF